MLCCRHCQLWTEIVHSSIIMDAELQFSPGLRTMVRSLWESIVVMRIVIWLFYLTSEKSGFYTNTIYYINKDDDGDSTQCQKVAESWMGMEDAYFCRLWDHSLWMICVECKQCNVQKHEEQCKSMKSNAKAWRTMQRHEEQCKSMKNNALC